MTKPNVQLEFNDLEKLRRFVHERLKGQVHVLEKFFRPRLHGFVQYLSKKKFSRLNSATCILSLYATGRWSEGTWVRDAEGMAKKMLDVEVSRDSSLPRDNPYTVGALVEASLLLNPDPSNRAPLDDRMRVLLECIKGGSAKIAGYPPSAYVTQMVLRVLSQQNKLDNATRGKAQKWSWSEVQHQLALIAAGSRQGDVFQLLYATLIVVDLGSENAETRAILDLAIDTFFKSQLPDGSWPSSKPLFHYPQLGTAYCYEYEALGEVLRNAEASENREGRVRLQERVLMHLEGLSRAAYALRKTMHEFDDGGEAWSSGHYAKVTGPEAWSTASVFRFLHGLDRVVAEQIRRKLFDYVDGSYFPPASVTRTPGDFAPKFLDCEVFANGQPRSLRDSILEYFVEPISLQLPRVRKGWQISEETAVSMILFGPPGTSKTELSKRIADFLGWPLLEIDPSHLVRETMDSLYGEADFIFRMLGLAEEVVVLLDEFDEMVKDREQGSEITSRFLTTVMLPKLARINKNRRMVVILATNHIEGFDIAASRQGRFDLIFQVMPPTLKAKTQSWPDACAKVERVMEKSEAATKLSGLTYLEFEKLVRDLGSMDDQQQILELVNDSFSHSTLQSPADPHSNGNEKWEDRCMKQRAKIRLPVLTRVALSQEEATTVPAK